MQVLTCCAGLTTSDLFTAALCVVCVASQALALLFKPFGRPSSPPSSMQAKSTPQVGKWINGAMRAAWPLAMGLLASAPLSESVARYIITSSLGRWDI
jgi:hypothetical protein